MLVSVLAAVPCRCYISLSLHGITCQVWVKKKPRLAAGFMTAGDWAAAMLGTFW